MKPQHRSHAILGSRLAATAMLAGTIIATAFAASFAATPGVFSLRDHARTQSMPAMSAPDGDAAVAQAHSGATPSLPLESMATWDGLPAVDARDSHSAVYDLRRNRLLVFGGMSSDYGRLNDVLALNMVGTPAWSLLAPAGSAPVERSGHAAVYDLVRDRMIVFGGQGEAGTLADLWQLTLAGTPAWHLLTPAGAAPSDRRDHAMVLDATRNRAILFGGRSATGSLDDTWVLGLGSTPSWTPLVPLGTPPPARSGHAMVYDRITDRVIVFGGQRGTTYLNDVWELRLAGTPEWREITPAGVAPSARRRTSAVIDPGTRSMLIFGGSNGTVLRDTWLLSLDGAPTWTQPVGPVAPAPARMGHTAVWDPRNVRIVIFGGSTGVIRLNDCWALQEAGEPNWSLLATGGSNPSPRVQGNLVYDAAGDRLVQFGGWDQRFRDHADVWTYPLGSRSPWQELAVTGPRPSPRIAAAAAIDPVRRLLVVTTGASGATFQNDTWVLPLGGTPQWSQLATSGPRPGARAAASVILDPVRDRLVLFAGTGSDLHPRNDTWVLPLAPGGQWTQLQPAGPLPPARESHTAIYDPVRDRMIIYAGCNENGLYQDVWALSFEGQGSWSEIGTAGDVPGARRYHTAVYDPAGDRMVIFGGDGQGSSTMYSNDCFALPLSGEPLWSALLPATSSPLARSGHAAAYDTARGRMIIHGGFGGSTEPFYDDTWALLCDEYLRAAGGGEGAMVLHAREGGLGVTPGDAGVAGLRSVAPNPSAGETVIAFTAPAAGSDVRITIHDVAGRVVSRLFEGRVSGNREVRWSGDDDRGARVAPGVYYARVDVGSAGETRRLIMIR